MVLATEKEQVCTFFSFEKRQLVSVFEIGIFNFMELKKYSNFATEKFTLFIRLKINY